MQIKDGVFVVTGGASGLGQATTEAIVARGGKVVILDIKEEQGKMMASTLGSSVLWPGETDITSEESVQRSLDLAIKTFGRLNGLVNAAGMGMVSKTLSTDGNPHPLDLFETTLRVNLIGTFNVSRLVAAILAKMPPSESEGERGVIINVASVAAFEGQVGQVAYTASKAGVAGMTLVMARDLGPFAIRVCCIAPGVFETPMTAMASKKVMAKLAANNEFPKRMGRPPEFAQLAVSIIENVMLNGETIRIDGGSRMPRM